MSPLSAGPLPVLGNERGLFSLLVLSHSDEACTCGQLVVASRESQYKIFHFHHGGLDKLSEVFQQWKYCTETHLKDQVPGQVHEAKSFFTAGVSRSGSQPAEGVGETKLRVCVTESGRKLQRAGGC